MIISKRTIFLPFILTIIALVGQEFEAMGARARTSREEYVSRYKHIAIDHQEYYGIPASVTMAQGILESDCGNSTLSRGSNNHFGIKCKSDWTGRTFTHTDDAPDECFRAYKNVEASYKDHAEFLDNSPRYDSLFDLEPTDYKGWARGLKAAGYATAPDYAERLIKIIEDNELYLLDSEAGVLSYNKRVKERLAKGSTESAIAGSIDPNNYGVTISSYGGYNIYNTNKTLYILAHGGESYSDVAAALEISVRSVRKYNDLDEVDLKGELEKGSVIYIERKQKGWHGEALHHTVKAGDTLHTISQMYALRLSSLCKLNGLKGVETLVEGRALKLRKE